MTTLSIRLLLVYHGFEAVGDRFKVKISVNSDIGDLKEKVKELKPDVFSLLRNLHDIGPDDLTMWKTVGELVLKRSSIQRKEDILKRINVDDEGTIQRLDNEVKVADLQLSSGQILVLQLPGMSYLYYRWPSHSVLSDMLNYEDLSRSASVIGTPIHDEDTISKPTSKEELGRFLWSFIPCLVLTYHSTLQGHRNGNQRCCSISRFKGC